MQVYQNAKNDKNKHFLWGVSQQDWTTIKEATQAEWDLETCRTAIISEVRTLLTRQLAITRADIALPPQVTQGDCVVHWFQQNVAARDVPGAIVAYVAAAQVCRRIHIPPTTYCQ
jgi:hypothetical protein